MSEVDFLSSIPSYGDGPGELALPVPPGKVLCDTCGFPVESFKHARSVARGLFGHDAPPETEPKAKPKAAAKGRK